MEVSNPRVGNFHLEQNTILDSFSCTTTPKIWFISRFCVFFSLGEMQFYHPGKKCGNFCLVCKKDCSETVEMIFPLKTFIMGTRYNRPRRQGSSVLMNTHNIWFKTYHSTPRFLCKSRLMWVYISMSDMLSS